MTVQNSLSRLELINMLLDDLYTDDVIVIHYDDLYTSYTDDVSMLLKIILQIFLP